MKTSKRENKTKKQREEKQPFWKSKDAQNKKQKSDANKKRKKREGKRKILTRGARMSSTESANACLAVSDFGFCTSSLVAWIFGGIAFSNSFIASSIFFLVSESFAFSACTSPQEYTGLGQGTHVFELRAAMDDVRLRGVRGRATLIAAVARFPANNRWPELAGARKLLAHKDVDVS